MITAIENYMKQFGQIQSGRSRPLIWNPGVAVMPLRRPADATAALVWYGLRLTVLAAALGLWQGLSAAGVIPASEFPSMPQTAAALWGLALGDPVVRGR